MTDLNWDDVRQCLEKAYFSERTHSALLLNRENGLNSSTTSLLNKSSAESVKTRRSLAGIITSIAQAYPDNGDARRSSVLADYAEESLALYVLAQAKGLDYPLGAAQRASRIRPDAEAKLGQDMQLLLNEMEDMVCFEEARQLQTTADSIFASLNEEYCASKAMGADDVMELTQSVRETNLSREPSNASNAANSSNAGNASGAGNTGSNPFMTAKQALVKGSAQNKGGANGQNQFNGGNQFNSGTGTGTGYNASAQARKLLGAKRRCVDGNNRTDTPQGNYRDEGRDINTEFSYYKMKNPPTNNAAAPNQPSSSTATRKGPSTDPQPPANEEPVDERLAGIEPRLIEMIRNEIMHRVDHIDWDSIAGLEHAKASIKEIVVWPMQRPDIFKGLRGPPKGLLLFGPPGTGKTMIGKCIASQANATFFSISASSLTSKWVGEGEKMVRALFAVARCSQPAVIFIDEIDSLLTQRTDGEFEASRRIKTEFLVQFDGAGTSSDDRILVIGATNRPQEIDEAARRRLLKRLYIPLPDAAARATIIRCLLSSLSHELTDEDIVWICEKADGYSGSDMDGLCREAALGPIRSLTDILNISSSEVRPIVRKDFEDALMQVRASVSNQDLDGYLEWNKQFGSLNVTKA